MGIKDLNNLLKRYSPDALFMMSISKLSGKKIAIDAFAWMFANLIICRKNVVNRTDVTVNEPDKKEIIKEFLSVLINFILKWINYDITPIFVFDGKNKPTEKDEVKEERYQIQKEKREKIDSLYEQISSDILVNNANLTVELRKALCNYNPIDKNVINAFQSLLDCIGIPWLQAEGDAEQLCASLCIEEKVAAVFSKDTDVLAFGCPLVIYGFSKGYHKDEFGRKTTMMDCARLDKCLEGLDITYQTFIDLCIMCGCDFNNHNNMVGHAALKSYKLLLPYKLIDKLPKSDKYNTDCLKYKRCREIFTFVSSEKLTINNDINDNNILDIKSKAYLNSNDILNKFNLNDELDKIFGTFQKFKGSTSGLLEDLSLKQADFNFTYIYPLRLNIIKPKVIKETNNVVIPITNIQENNVTGQKKILRLNVITNTTIEK